MRPSLFVSLTLASALAVLTACGDAVTGPDGARVSAEAEAVMRSAEALPLLPRFLDAAEPADAAARATLVRARELWDEGTALDDPGAVAQRRLAVSHALPVLVESVPVDDWTAARGHLDEWVSTAGLMLRHVSLPDVEARVEAARRQLRSADRASSERRRVHHLLLASSELVETTPRFVARVMVRDAADAVRRAAGADVAARAVDAESLARAQRMSAWSARALEEGDYLLAIQRAYYAVQLVAAP